MTAPTITQYHPDSRNNNPITRKHCGEFCETKQGTRLLILEVRPELVADTGFRYKGVVNDRHQTLGYNGHAFNLDNNFMSGDDLEALYTALAEKRDHWLELMNEAHTKMNQDSTPTP